MVVASHVRQAREGRGLDLRRAAYLARLSPTTWNGVELGRSSRGRTYGRIEMALEMRPGTLQHILETGIAPTAGRPRTLTPTSPGGIMIAGLIELMEKSTEVPRADRVSIIASMNAALTRMEDEDDRPEREVG